MRHIIQARLGILVLSTTLFLPGFTVLAGPPTTAKIKWSSDVRAAHRVAVREKKPMLIVFGADWCGYCKKLEQTTLADPRMASYINSGFIAVHVDVDDTPDVAEILGVEGLPCTIVLSPNADLLGRIEGYKNVNEYHEQLAAARKRLSPTVAQ